MSGSERAKVVATFPDARKTKCLEVPWNLRSDERQYMGQADAHWMSKVMPEFIKRWKEMSSGLLSLAQETEFTLTMGKGVPLTRQADIVREDPHWYEQWRECTWRFQGAEEKILSAPRRLPTTVSRSTLIPGVSVALQRGGGGRTAGPRTKKITAGRIHHHRHIK